MKNILLVLLAIALIGFWAYPLIMGDPDELGVVVNPIQSGKTILPNPADGAAASSTTGTLTNGEILYFKITSIDHAGGQTMPSNEFEGTAGSGRRLLVTFTPTPGADESRLWIATSSGVYYGYKTATSSYGVATSTGLTAGTLPRVNSAYLFNSGVAEDNTWLKAYVTADTLVKSGPTLVHSITYSPSDAEATAGSIIIFDALTPGTGTSTTYGVPAAAIAPNTIILNQMFENGLYVDFVTTADVNVNISYK